MRRNALICPSILSATGLFSRSGSSFAVCNNVEQLVSDQYVESAWALVSHGEGRYWRAVSVEVQQTLMLGCLELLLHPCSTTGTLHVTEHSLFYSASWLLKSAGTNNEVSLECTKRDGKQNYAKQTRTRLSPTSFLIIVFFNLFGR